MEEEGDCYEIGAVDGSGSDILSSCLCFNRPATSGLQTVEHSGSYTYTSQDLEDEGRIATGIRHDMELRTSILTVIVAQLWFADNWELYAQLGIADIKLTFIS
jgi:hypothetical protein